MRRISIPRFSRAGPNDSLNIVSRRRFVGYTAAAAGVTLGSGLLIPARGDPGEEPCPGGAPDPIPHLNTRSGTHFFFPGHADGSFSATDNEDAHVEPNGRDPSTIFDFDGFIGEADLNLSGMGTDTTTGATAPYVFHTDMRFMTGRFLATDGRVHKGTFAFI